MKIRRTIPPTAAPVTFADLLYGAAGFFFGRRYLQQLEEELREYFSVKHVFLMSSGKAALTVILRALHSLSPEKNEVVIPAYTCYSVPSSIVKAGLRVVLCDIDRVTFDFDHTLLGDVVNDSTLCIVPTHLFGMPVDVEKIKNLRQNRSLYVVEDAAQAMGGRHGDRKLGTLGDVGFFSMGRGKHITCGSGGIIVTNNSCIAEALSRECSHLESAGIGENIYRLLEQAAMKVFMHPSLYWLPAGIPMLKLGRTIFYRDFPIKKMSGMKAGLLHNWLKRLSESNRIRSTRAAVYRSRITGATCAKQDGTFLRYPVLAADRQAGERAYAHAGRYGVGRMYPAPINEITELASQFNDRTYSAAKDVSERLITLPTHQLISNDDQRAICRIVNQDGDKMDGRISVSEGLGA